MLAEIYENGKLLVLLELYSVTRRVDEPMIDIEIGLVLKAADYS